MSLTKELQKLRSDLSVITLDMKNLDRQNLPDFTNRRRLWIKVLQGKVDLLDAILKKGCNGTKKR